MNKKFGYVNFRIFLIKAKKRASSYKLKSFKILKVIFIFYILLLKLANLINSIQKMLYYQFHKENKLKIEKFLYKKG